MGFDRVSDARYAAFSCLCSILLKRHTLQRSFTDYKPLGLLEPRDRAFAHLLTNSVFTKLGDARRGCKLSISAPIDGR